MQVVELVAVILDASLAAGLEMDMQPYHTPLG